MSIRSVDLQTMIPRLTETSRQQHNADLQPFVVQHAATAQAHERAAREQSQVKQKSETERAALQKDREGDGRQARDEKTGTRRGKREPDKQAAPEKRYGNRLDVKV